MKDMFRQYPLDKRGKEFESTKVDPQDMRLEFEREMGKYLLYRTLVEKDDGSKTTYDTYRVPISQSDNVFEIDIRTIHDAAVLGYRSVMAPIVVPDGSKLFGADTQTRPYILLFLEKPET